MDDGSSSSYCSCSCKHCGLHKYGVLLLNPSSIIIFSVVAYVYWNEICAYFSGTAKYKPVMGIGAPAESSGVDSRQMAPDALESLKGPGEVPTGGQNYVASYMPPPVSKMLMQRTISSPSPPRSPAGVSPPSPPQPNATVINMGRGTTSPSSPPNLMATQDPFKLPKTPVDPPPPQSPSKPSSPLKRHESTGSDYFKQMMRGKKPVASISQYAQLKNLKDGKDKKRDKRHDKKGESDKRHHKEKKHKDKKK